MITDRMRTRIAGLSDDLRAVADALDSLRKDQDAKPEAFDRLARLGVQTVAYALKDMVYEMAHENRRASDPTPEALP